MHSAECFIKQYAGFRYIRNINKTMANFQVKKYTYMYTHTYTRRHTGRTHNNSQILSLRVTVSCLLFFVTRGLLIGTGTQAASKWSAVRKFYRRHKWSRSLTPRPTPPHPAVRSDGGKPSFLPLSTISQLRRGASVQRRRKSTSARVT